ncbi:DUF4476 domain-containing protein [Armatimonas sp.]|uniref:DUF4476 domain-containing protein n=1 Tax=Armatimonas sp. TaxID=1872638 RepID=UPI00286B3B93|nr:DUF4476 domain-containing protein [Armatimonas sp.]
MKQQMSLVLAAVVSVGVLVPVWAQQSRERARAASPEGMARNLSLDLREARELLDRVMNNRVKDTGGARERETRRDSDTERRRLEVLLENAERDARELERQLGSRQGSGFIPPTDRNSSRQAMRDADFELVVFSVRRAKTARDEMQIVRQLAAQQWISTNQLRDLLKVVDQPSDQEETAFLLYQRLSDISRFYTIRDSFKSSSSWQTVCQRLGIR